MKGKRLYGPAARGALYALLILLVLAALFFFNGTLALLSARYPLALDLTRSAAYRLDEQTLELLQQLEAPVTIEVLATRDSFEGNPYLVQARNIMDQYPRHSPRVRLRYVDYAAEPAFAASYPELSLQPGNILVSSGGNTRQLTLKDLFNYSYSQSSATGTAVSSSRAQEALSSAILQVTSESRRRAVLLTGAGTAQMPALQSLLKDNNFDVETLNLVSDDWGGADLCLLLAPTVDLSLEALEKLDGFLYNEGRYGKALCYFMDASQPALPRLEAFLAEWGVRPIDGAVFETSQQRTFGMQPFYPLAEYSDEESSARLRDRSMPVLLPRAKPFALLFSSRDNQHTRELLRFSDTAGVRPSQAGSDFDPAKAQIRGPMPAMALLTRQVRDAGSGQSLSSVILLSSSAAMLDAATLHNSSLSNAEYLLGAVDRLSSQEARVQVRPVSLASAYLGINSAQAKLWGALLIGVIPGLLLLAGVAVWLYRRHQ